MRWRHLGPAMISPSHRLAGGPVSVPMSDESDLEEHPPQSFARPAWMRYTFDHRDVVPGNRAALLVDGVQAFPAMLGAIEAARRTVCLETYILEDDFLGRRFSDALVSASARGVECSVIVDAVGSGWLSRSFIRRLEDAGVELRIFRPLSAKAKLDFAVRRDHRKLLVVDGEVAFVGGMNLHAEAAPRSEGGAGWHDFAVEVRGPIIRHLLELFSETWDHIRPRPSRPLRAELEGGRSGLAGDVALRAVGTDAARGRWEIRRSLLYAIRRARRSVLIANAYFVPDVGVLRTLKATARRGVRVAVLLPSRSDILVVDYASGAVYDQLLRSGVELYLWHQSVLHAKVAVVDSAWSMVGSYNLDWFSLLRNREAVINILDEPFGQELSRVLEADLEVSERLTLETWRDRPLWRRWVAEPTAYAFRRYL